MPKKEKGIKEKGIKSPQLPPEDQPLFASQLMQVLVDRMAALGDFEVSWDFLKNGHGRIEAQLETDAIEQARSQGENYAKLGGDLEHNPFDPKSDEGKAWMQGFKGGQ